MHCYRAMCLWTSLFSKRQQQNVCLWVNTVLHAEVNIFLFSANYKIITISWNVSYWRWYVKNVISTMHLLSYVLFKGFVSFWDTWIREHNTIVFIPDPVVLIAQEGSEVRLQFTEPGSGGAYEEIVWYKGSTGGSNYRIVFVHPSATGGEPMYYDDFCSGSSPCNTSSKGELNTDTGELTIHQLSCQMMITIITTSILMEVQLILVTSMK